MKAPRLAALLLCLGVLLSGCAATRAEKEPTTTPGAEPTAVLSGASTKTLTSVVSFDGHRIPITVYKPVEADADHPVPIILHSHGWAGQRSTADDPYRDFHKAGFGVISIDMRGHGEARSTSTAQIHHMDYEIKDVREVITFLTGLDWTAKDRSGDPIVGSVGGSYGGAYQLLVAATDPRLDAIAPEITWSDLVDSLSPGGAIKSAWIDLLYVSGNANARLHPNIHQGFAIAHGSNRIPDGSLPGEYDLESQLRRSSPASYPAAIRVPTLLIQGVNDTLFNLNQAVENYGMIQATGADVRLVTHLGGHILNTRGTIPVPAPQPLGLQAPMGGSPCGNLRNLTIAFYQQHLLRLHRDLGPSVCLALEDGGVVLADEYPPKRVRTQTLDLGAATLYQPAPGVNVSLHVLRAGDEGTVLAGIPRLRANVTTTGDTILFFSLQARRGDALRTLNAQVTPHHIASTGSMEIDLAGIGAHLLAGEELQLSISTTSDQFAHNGGRTPAVVSLQNTEIELPTMQRH